MTIATEFGNFGSFKDLSVFMRLEEKVSVFISSADWWGINCIISPSWNYFYEKGDRGNCQFLVCLVLRLLWTELFILCMRI